MLPGNYADFSPKRGDRAVRTIVLATTAALVGVIAGGVSVFAVVSALMAPPRHDLHAAAAPKDDNAPPPVVTATLQPTPVAPAPASAPVEARPMPDLPPVAQQPNSWPDALSRAHHASEPQPTPAQTAAPQAAPAQTVAPQPAPVQTVAPQAVPVQTVAPQTAPSAVAKGQVEMKQTNRTADRAEDTRQLPAGGGNRTARPLYDSAGQNSNGQDYSAPAKRRGVVTSRTVQPAPDNTLGASPGERDDQNHGFFFFGHDDREQSQGMSRDFADRPDAAPRESDLREPRASYGDRNAAKTRAAHPQQRPGYDQNSDGQFDSLIGTDQWVDDWHH